MSRTLCCRSDAPAMAYRELNGVLDDAGLLDRKTRSLVRLTISVGCAAEGAVRTHVRMALEDGITPGEIEHVILLVLTTAVFLKSIADLKWICEVVQAGE